jgi:GT2 family glycosyltransferase
MSSSVYLRNECLSIVIPSARYYPSDLITQLRGQTVEGDEILLVQNHPRLGSHSWTGIASVSRSTKVCDKSRRLHDNFKHYAETVKLKGTLAVFLSSDEGAAAARNLGWRNAKNDLILFLDDDITVSETFLTEIRQYLAQRPLAGVTTLRVTIPTTCRWSPLINATISLDRGSAICHTDRKPLRLQNVWRYGAGAAMLINRKVLEATSGFKDQFGAGRENGGTEDTEFLWHASHHSTIEYNGRIVVFHKNVSNLKTIATKMREYGRAIGNLGGTAKSDDGYRYMAGYCSHLESAKDMSKVYSLSTREKIRVKRAISVAVSETIHAYVSSMVHSSKAGVLCDKCRGILS